MKKATSILVGILVIVIALAGCGSKTTENQVSTPTNSNGNVVQNNESKSKADSHNSSKTDSKSVVNNADFNVFWSDFREAVLNNNVSEMEKFTQFPLETRGPYDFNPVIKFDKSKFEKIMNLYLKEKIGTDVDFTETQLEYIRNHKNLDSLNAKQPVVQGGNWARVGDMQFKLINGSWKLTFVYLSGESYKQLGIDIGAGN